MKRMISGILVATLVFGASSAWAADNDNPTGPSGPAAPGSFRLAVEHTLAEMVIAPVAKPATQLQPATHVIETTAAQARRSAQPTTSGGSGGGHAMATVMTLAGVVGGIVGTAYMIKAMKKATAQTKP
jgi:hypothetical protein